ncbi:MAG: spore protease YyaC [Clostridia bacterium]|nr:spore protease YyaC [Clostridia bacterium]
MNEVYAFSTFYDYTKKGIVDALKNFAPENKNFAVICIGSDLILGDSLGPLVGTMLKNAGASCYVYGNLTRPITAKEIGYAKNYVKKTHPDSFIIAVDAAIGNKEDVGTVKVSAGSLRPGLGVDKKLGKIGDVSVIGVVASRSLQNYNLFNLTRLSLVYKMAETIAAGISEFSGASDFTLKKEKPLAI